MRFPAILAATLGAALAAPAIASPPRLAPAHGGHNLLIGEHADVHRFSHSWQEAQSQESGGRRERAGRNRRAHQAARAGAATRLLVRRPVKRKRRRLTRSTTLTWKASVSGSPKTTTARKMRARLSVTCRAAKATR